MKKRIITIMAALMMLAGSATAQVFYMAEEDELNMRAGSGDGLVFNVLEQDMANDQWPPLATAYYYCPVWQGFTC